MEERERAQRLGDKRNVLALPQPSLSPLYFFFFFFFFSLCHSHNRHVYDCFPDYTGSRMAKRTSVVEWTTSNYFLGSRLSYNFFLPFSQRWDTAFSRRIRRSIMKMNRESFSRWLDNKARNEKAFSHARNIANGKSCQTHEFLPRAFFFPLYLTGTSG